MADTNQPNDQASRGVLTPNAGELAERAVEARRRGDFTEAADLFGEAARRSTDLYEQLSFELRRAYCLMAMQHNDEAISIAQFVAQRSRSEGYLDHLADALGLLVDHHLFAGQLAEASHALAEAMFALDQLPNDPSTYQVVHNTAATYSGCGFYEAALTLFDRALRLADNDADRQYVYGNMAAAYHFAALDAEDETIKSQMLHDGLYAATAALDPEGAGEVVMSGLAYAHRSMMLCQIGHYEGALNDARRARAITTEHCLREEQVIAMAGEAISRWRLHQDTAILELISDTLALAAELNDDRHLQMLRDTEVEVLWHERRYDEARACMQRNVRSLERRVHQEAAARWEHVRLGVEHLRMEQLSESDPLTGLPNRRYLNHWLPEVLDKNPPVCVGVIDLDGFKVINDEYGYDRGDRVLQEVSTMLERVCRRGDAVVRIGGDEFVMVVRETSLGDARVVFERIRQLVGMHRWDGLPSTVTMTASVGVAVGTGAFSAGQVLHDATEAMQRAKRSGRDRIVFG